MNPGIFFDFGHVFVERISKAGMRQSCGTVKSLRGKREQCKSCVLEARSLWAMSVFFPLSAQK